jgi:hypothetical protein
MSIEVYELERKCYTEFETPLANLVKLFFGKIYAKINASLLLKLRQSWRKLRLQKFYIIEPVVEKFYLPYIIKLFTVVNSAIL